MQIAFQTCDLCDVYAADDAAQLRVLPPGFQHFGGVPAFAGQVVTLKCLEDNTLVKEALQVPGQGRVLVVDGGGSLRRALVGGNLAALAAAQGWAGILVFGAVRDVQELRAAAVGIAALALMPLPTQKKGMGLRDIPIEVAGVPVRPGDWLYADADGVVLGGRPLHD